MWVTVWGKTVPHRDPQIKLAKKVKKKSCFREKTGLFGAAGRIRTADLILTKLAGTRLVSMGWAARNQRVTKYMWVKHKSESG